MQYNVIIPIFLILYVIFLRSSVSVFYRKKIDKEYDKWVFSHRIKYPLYAYIIAFFMIFMSTISNLLAWLMLIIALLITSGFFAFQEIEDVDKNYQRKVMLYFPSNIFFNYIKKIYRKFKYLIMFKI